MNFLTHARHARAFPGNFDFLLSQPSQKGSFFRQNIMFPIMLMDGRVSYLLSIGEHLLAMFSVCLTNFVPNRAIII